MDDNEKEKQTLVEEGTEFSGTLRAKCKVVVRGGIEGELEAPSVDIADTGSVTGTLRATTVRSQGTLAGTVEVDDISVAGKVESATVIRAKTLEVKLGTQEGRLEVTFGDCVLEVGDMPGDQPEVDDSKATGDKAPEAEAAGAQAEAPSDASADSPDGDADGGSRRARKRKNRGKRRGKQAEGADDSAEASDGDAESAADGGASGDADDSPADAKPDANADGDASTTKPVEPGHAPA